MSNNNTQSSIDEMAAVNRKQIEHRATWMALIYDEMVKAGIDGEAIIRRAIKRCGQIHGENLKKRCDDPNNIEDFKKAFLSDVGMKTFEMQVVNDVASKEATSNKATSKETASFNIDFHFCALVNAWKKLGLDDKTCALLCDMAMDGDRSIAEVMGLQFKLGRTIAQGCPDCQLRFRK
jgi:hypothetical protein